VGADAYQPETAASMPRPMRWLVVGSVASVVLLLALPVMMLIDRNAVVATILGGGTQMDASDREWLLANLDRVFGFVMLYTVVLHAVCIGVLSWFTPKAVRGRNWARIGLSVFLIAVTCLSIISAAQGGMFLAFVIPSDIIHVLMLVLLWVPPSVGRFYAEHRSAPQTKALRL
jgi:hypothetical protein